MYDLFEGFIFMTVLFIRFFPLIDGSLTLKIRLAQKLNQLGHKTYFLFTCPISDTLEADVARVSPVLFYKDLETINDQGKLPCIDAIHAGADGDSIYKVFDIKNQFFKDAAVVFCAWATNAFIHTSRLGFSPDGLFYKYFFNQLPEQNIAFPGNGVIKRKHQAFLKKMFDTTPAVNNALQLPPVLKQRERINKKKIVTITRLAPAKEYVFSTLVVIKELRSKGFEYEFHVYGGGPYLNLLKEKVESEKMHDYVHLHGEIAYSKVNEVLMETGFFIGMGGSIIEAAALGIPSIQAIEYHEEPTAYGWFHELNDGELGEFDKEKKKVKLFDLLVEAYALDNEAYSLMAEKSFASAQYFSIDNVIERYIKFLQGADKEFTFHFPTWKRWLLKAARQPVKFFALSPQETIQRI
jgi:glycosyltransferase involved in cell wall biosynthesis